MCDLNRPDFPPAPDPYVMTSAERRASGALAAIFALRMLGLFLVLPVFALEASRYPGGDNPVWLGWAMGIYGLTQACLQIPLGLASDRWGRKRIIQAGLAVFAAGSLVAAWAPSIEWLLAGRALQGAGAISAAITALLADLTRDSVRTKGMAMIGVSIALMFATSLIVAPWLAVQIGLSGLFVVTAGLTVVGMGVVAWVVPAEPARTPTGRRAGLRVVLRDAGLLRLDLGVFVLHAVQLAMWMAVPALLVQAGMAQGDHWKVYLLAMLGALAIMGGMLFRLERMGYLRAVFLLSIGLMMGAQVLLWGSTGPHPPTLSVLAMALFLFFLAFNTLEATQPSLVSRLAPPEARGAALGVYNTLQSLGFFVGGAAGGWIMSRVGADGLFVACGVLCLIWLVVAWPMRAQMLHNVNP